MENKIKHLKLIDLLKLYLNILVFKIYIKFRCKHNYI